MGSFTVCLCKFSVCLFCGCFQIKNPIKMEAMFNALRNSFYTLADGISRMVALFVPFNPHDTAEVRNQKIKFAVGIVAFIVALGLVGYQYYDGQFDGYRASVPNIYF